MSSPLQAATLIDLDFNSDLNSQGDLAFDGAGTFQVVFTDDNSSGSPGGDADGVHVNNINFGNIKAGSPTDFVSVLLTLSAGATTITRAASSRASIRALKVSVFSTPTMTQPPSHCLLLMNWAT